MNLTEFKSVLTQHQEKPFHILLPGGGEVPQAFHITEAAHVAKKFVDCGGQVHRTDTVQLQAWVGEDDDHRLHAAKLLGILDKAATLVFPDNADELSVELEYEDCTLSQYPVDAYEVRDGAVVLLLTKKHTDCLAKDKCMVPAAAGAPAVSSCCGGGKC